jgi:hypothetical protein
MSILKTSRSLALAFLIALLAACASDGIRNQNSATAKREVHPFETRYERWLRVDPFASFHSPLLLWRDHGNFLTTSFWDVGYASYHPFFADPWLRYRSVYVPGYYWPYGYAFSHGRFDPFWSPGYYYTPRFDRRGRHSRHGLSTSGFDDSGRGHGRYGDRAFDQGPALERSERSFGDAPFAHDDFPTQRRGESRGDANTEVPQR